MCIPPLNPKPETLHPKPYTLNPLNSKPKLEIDAFHPAAQYRTGGESAEDKAKTSVESGAQGSKPKSIPERDVYV